MPALVIIIDEYAELADEAPDAMSDTDSIARLGRAVAVTLVAATQRPTQKAMGQGAVRSQMDTRICFRVRERKDVDLILGQGMLAAGWHAHALNAPGKFLVSAPEHTTPKRARAYLVTDDDVARIVAQLRRRTGPSWTTCHAARSTSALRSPNPSRGTSADRPARPRRARRAPRTVTTPPRRKARSGSPSARPPTKEPTSPNSCASAAWPGPPCTGTSPRTPRPGRAIQVSRGRWRATTTEDELTMSSCLTHLSRLTPRACLHVNARTRDDETNAETSYPQAAV